MSQLIKEEPIKYWVELSLNDVVHQIRDQFEERYLEYPFYPN